MFTASSVNSIHLFVGCIHYVAKVSHYVTNTLLEVCRHNRPSSLVPRPYQSEKWPGFHCLHMCELPHNSERSEAILQFH